MRREDPAQCRTANEQPAVQLTVYVAEPHVADRRSKVDELLRRAAAAGVAGGTVVAAYQGFGRRHSHEPTMWHRPHETPLTVVFVDAPDRIAAVLDALDDLLPDAVAVSQHVTAVRYAR